MKLTRNLLLSTVLCLAATAASFAQTVNVVNLTKLKPGCIYRAKMVDVLDASRLTDIEVQIATLLDDSGGAERIRLEIDSVLDNNVLMRIGEATLVTNSTGLRIHEWRYGPDSQWMNEYGIRCTGGVLMGYAQKVDVWRTTSVPITNFFGAPHFSNGCEYGVYTTGNNGLLTGYFVNWTWDAGPTFSLWTNTTGGLKGLEMDWNYFLITQQLR